MLAEIRTSWRDIWYGWLIRFTSFSARVAASAGSRASISRTNSSPPRRAMVSWARTLGDFDQQQVAEVMAVGIVDRLEAVQVHEQHGEPAIVADRLLDRLLQAVVESMRLGSLVRVVVQGQLDQLAVGSCEGGGEHRGTCLQARVQHRDDQGDGDHRQGDHDDQHRQPAVVDASAGGAAEAAQGNCAAAIPV